MIDEIAMVIDFFMVCPFHRVFYPHILYEYTLVF